MSTLLGWGAIDAGTTLTALQTTITTGTQVTSAAVDNTVATLAQAAYEEASLLLVCTSFTPSATPPFVTATITEALDGTNYETAAVSGTTLYPVVGSRSVPLNAVAQTVVRVPGLQLKPVLFKVSLFNNAGVSMIISTAKLFRFLHQAG